MHESALVQEVAALPAEVRTALLRRLEGEELELPLLPDVVWEVLELSTADETDARKLATLIHRDQALAGHVLRVANSPAYLPRMPIVSLQQAVSRLGIAQLCEIVFAVALQSRVFDVPGYECELRALWRHAVGAAAYAKEIARMRRSNVEGAFLCGLLHDVGKPVILQALVDVQKACGAFLEPGIVEALLEAYHTRVGERLARRWELPPHVIESIAYHHEYLVTPACNEAVMITRLADVLSYHLLQPEVFDVESVRQHPVLPELDFYPEDVESLLAKREAMLQLVEAFA
ncbi:MAG: hypothetical protein KatS3mg131_2844 [Candidatus Tectimicrobiota bacterium]|nr:MAG: hypothetical protein KatS3mg131_2844 [Candidatus Tectomicrobia bacterium]